MKFETELGNIIGPKGGNWAYFVKNTKFIGEFIKNNRIQPSVIGQVAAEMAAPAKAHIDLGIRGGMRVPHLHFNDKIYLLNNEQWAKFSDTIITDSREKLANVKKISFEEGMLLESVVQGLGM